MDVCLFESCVLSGRGPCDELIPRPEESYRLCCVVVCDLETSWMRRTWPTGGCRAQEKCTHYYVLIYNTPTYFGAQWSIIREWSCAEQSLGHTISSNIRNCGEIISVWCTEASMYSALKLWNVNYNDLNYKHNTEYETVNYLVISITHIKVLHSPESHSALHTAHTPYLDITCCHIAA
jgi:hypothetical protein